MRGAVIALVLLVSGAMFGACGACAEAVRQNKRNEADQKACNRNDATACMRIGAVHINAYRANSSTNMGSLEVALNGYAGACGGGISDGCLELANLYGQESSLHRERAHAIEYGVRACDLGAGLGCLIAIRHMKPDDPRALTLPVRACDLDPGLCVVAATILQPVQPTVARDLARRACGSGRPADCAKAAEVPLPEPDQNDLARRACDEGQGAKCVFLAARLQTGGHKDEAIIVLRIGCRQRHEDSCAELGELLSATPP